MCQVVRALEPGGTRVEQGQVGGCEGWLPAAGGGVYKHHSGIAGVSGGILRWRMA